MVLVAGTVAVLPSVLLGWRLLPGNGFDAGHGYASLSLADGSMLRATIGSVLYLGLIALLSLGVATAVRDSAVAIGIVLSLLFMFPIIAHFVSDTTLQRHLEQIGPMTAGMAIQDTVNLASQPIGPWAGLGVLAAWAAGALLLGGLVLRLRDA
jgi:ABC-2 type transport system permease protein